MTKRSPVVRNALKRAGLDPDAEFELSNGAVIECAKSDTSDPVITVTFIDGYNDEGDDSEDIRKAQALGLKAKASGVDREGFGNLVVKGLKSKILSFMKSHELFADDVAEVQKATGNIKLSHGEIACAEPGAVSQRAIAQDIMKRLDEIADECLGEEEDADDNALTKNSQYFGTAVRAINQAISILGKVT